MDSIVMMSGTMTVGGCRTDLTGRARVRWSTRVRDGVYAAELRFEDTANRFGHSEVHTGEAAEVDYYEVLEVNFKATPDTIHRVYRILAQRYHPDNTETGNEELFKQLLEAYRVLSNPEQRAAYDVHGSDRRQTQWKIFEHAAVSQGFEGERRKRYGILSLLYAKRVNEPDLPGLNRHELEDLLGCPREHLVFSLWYLKENHYITRGDNGRHSITAKGVEYAETSSPAGALNRLLTPAKS